MFPRAKRGNRYIVVSLMICIVGLIIQSSLAQTDIDVITDIPSADVGLFEWSPDSALFTFVDTSRLVTPTDTFSPVLPDMAWQAFNISTRRPASTSHRWELQPEIEPQNYPGYFPNQFIYASPDGSVFLYRQEGEQLDLPTVPDAASIAIANAATRERLSLDILSRIPFSPESDAQVYWAATNRAVAFSTTSAGDGIVEPLRIYHVQLDSVDPLNGHVREANVQIDGMTYTTVNASDRLLAISPDGESVLFIGAPDPRITPDATQHSELILWRPDGAQDSQVLVGLDAATICHATFAPDASDHIVVTLQDGRIALYDTAVGSVQFLSRTNVPGCPTQLFSPDGRWLAVPYTPSGYIGFQDIAQRIAETSAPTLIAPIADAGADIVLTDSSGNDQATLILDGTGSVDPDGRLLTFVWSIGRDPLRTNGAVVDMDLSREQVGEGLVFTLTVGDEDGLIGRDSLRVTFEPPVATLDQTTSASSRNIPNHGKS